MLIEIFSDVACPWCYIAKRRLEQALQSFEHRGEVDILWRSYELRPNLVEQPPYSSAEELIHTKGLPADEARQMAENVTKLGTLMGLDLRFDITKIYNTRLAHQLVHYAGDLGRQDEMKERLFHATFTEGRDLSSIDALAEMAADIGLDAENAREALWSGRYLDDVLADEQRAEALGVQIPYALFDGKHVVTGAKRAETFRQTLELAWSEAHPSAA